MTKSFLVDDTKREKMKGGDLHGTFDAITEIGFSQAVTFQYTSKVTYIEP